MGTLGDGLKALRALALLGQPSLPKNATFRERLGDELAWEAKKFLIYRASRMMDRELLAVHRLRSLQMMLKLAA